MYWERIVNNYENTVWVMVLADGKGCLYKTRDIHIEGERKIAVYSVCYAPPIIANEQDKKLDHVRNPPGMEKY